ncbi:MAG: MFS transporter [Bacteroides sp.]|nr:MFS transporter [Bacteroides sp.]MCM1413869.1 MFS transporter [Bacteroides sp.]MCM1471022.1 MFS transporter [Bacteroides sp.]
MKKSFVALAIVTFALGVAEFGMMGILTDVAKGTGISIAEAGHFISAYSLGVAIGAPLLLLFRNLPLRRLLLLLCAIIVVGNAAAALSLGFNTLLIARFISGLPHGAFFGAGAIVCSRLADPGKGAVAVAVMVGGMTIANVFGVPLSTFISNLLVWRLSFAIVALCGVAGFVAIRCWVPVMKPLPESSLKGQFAFLRNPGPWLIYGGVFFGQASVYCYFSYVEPLMTEVVGFPTADMTWIMMVAGAGMVVGNALSGKLATRFGEARVSGFIALALVLIMPAIYFATSLKILSVVLMFAATAGLFGIGGPLQYLIVRYAKGGEMLGGAGIQIAFNVSNAVSASLGAMMLYHGFSLASPALLGVPFAAIGALSLFILVHRQSTTASDT